MQRDRRAAAERAPWPPSTTAIVHLHMICPVHSVYSGGADNVNMLDVAAEIAT